MALTLTLHETQGFYINGRRWYVEDYDDDGVTLVGPPLAEGTPVQRVRITEREAIEIEPEVFVQEGYIPEQGCRVVLDAPKKISILRDELFERGGAAAGAQASASHDPGGRKP